MLSDITTPDRMDNVSSQGYAWGYIGSCIPFVLCLLVVLTTGVTGLSMGTAMMIAFIIVAAWWAGCSLPLLKIYKQKHFVERQPGAVESEFCPAGENPRGAEKRAAYPPLPRRLLLLH